MTFRLFAHSIKNVTLQVIMRNKPDMGWCLNERGEARDVRNNSNMILYFDVNNIVIGLWHFHYYIFIRNSNPDENICPSYLL